MRNYSIAAILIFLLGATPSLVAIPMEGEKLSTKKTPEQGSIGMRAAAAHEATVRGESTQESNLARGENLLASEKEAAAGNAADVSSDENSDEGKTTQEATSNRPSETLEVQERTLLEDPWNMALQRLQDEEARWHSIRPDMLKRCSLKEVNDSFLRATSVFRTLENQGYAEQAIKRIEFAIAQYVQARKVHSPSDGSISAHYEEAAEAAKQSASQYIIAAECLLKAREADTNSDIEIASHWRESSGEAEVAGRYYQQEAEASQSQDRAAWNRWRRFAWTTQCHAEQLGKTAAYLQEFKKTSSRGGEGDEFAFWSKAIERAEASSTYYTQALQAHAQGDDAVWLSYTNAARAAQNSAQQFKKSALYLQQAAEVASSHPGSAAETSLRKASKKAFSAAEILFQAEQAHLQSSEEAERLQQAAAKDQSKAEEHFMQADRIRQVEIKRKAPQSVKEPDIDPWKLPGKVLPPNETPPAAEIENIGVNITAPSRPLAATTRDSENIIPLRKFTTAIKNNPSSKRLLIEEQAETSSVIASHSWNPMRLLWNSNQEKEKNHRVAAALKSALLAEYQDKREVVNDLIEDAFLHNNTADWSASKISQIIQAVDEKADPTIAPLLAIDAERYPGARVIAQKMEDTNSNIRVRILKTSLKDPYVRIEEEIDSSGNVTNRQRMLADRITIRLPKEKTLETFYTELKRLVAPLVVEVNEIMSPRYHVHFKPSLEALPTILEASRSLQCVASPNFVSLQTLTNDKYYNKQWNLQTPYGIAAPRAWELQKLAKHHPANDQSMGIAVFDTGINYDHEDLRSMTRSALPGGYGVDFVNGKLPQDEDGHGTHCAGIIGAYRNNSLGIAGIVQDIRLMAFKISADGRDINYDNIVTSIQHAYAMCAIKIFNASLGDKLEKDKDIYPRYTKEAVSDLLAELKTLHNRDAILVVAAGNDQKNNDIFQPYLACCAKTEINSDGAENILVVAATNEKGQIATSFSNYGKKTVHLAAPGTDIWSTIVRQEPTWGWFRTKNNAYGPLSGTSMAAPHVTAALALMRQEFPLASATNLIAKLLATTDPIPTLDENGQIILNEHTIAG